MLHALKAYVNSKGQGPLLLTHDVRRCLRESGAVKGMITVLSTDTNVGVTLADNDPHKASMEKQDQAPSFCGLSLTLAFDQGKLLMSPHHNIVGVDLHQAPGRREFMVTVMGEAKEAKEAKA